MALFDEISLLQEVEKLLKEIRAEIKYAENVKYHRSFSSSTSTIQKIYDDVLIDNKSNKSVNSICKDDDEGA